MHEIRVLLHSRGSASPFSQMLVIVLTNDFLFLEFFSAAFTPFNRLPCIDKFFILFFIIFHMTGVVCNSFYSLQHQCLKVTSTCFKKVFSKALLFLHLLCCQSTHMFQAPPPSDEPDARSSSVPGTSDNREIAKKLKEKLQKLIDERLCKVCFRKTIEMYWKALRERYKSVGPTQSFCYVKWQLW